MIDSNINFLGCYLQIGSIYETFKERGTLPNYKTQFLLYSGRSFVHGAGTEVTGSTVNITARVLVRSWLGHNCSFANMKDWSLDRVVAGYSLYHCAIVFLPTQHAFVSVTKRTQNIDTVSFLKRYSKVKKLDHFDKSFLYFSRCKRSRLEAKRFQVKLSPITIYIS